MLETSTPFVLSALAAICLALVHFFADRVDCSDTEPRSRWLSFASGVSVSYVFVHLLPDLSEQQIALSETGVLAFLDQHAYLLALLGLTIFYELEQVVQLSQTVQLEAQPERDPKVSRDDTTGNRIFWLHISSFSAYNALVGYLLLHRETPGLHSLLLYTIAMGLHFFVNDRGLHRTHRSAYRRIGRWLLAASTVIGWLVGIRLEVSKVLLAILFSFLGGGVVLNVLKEEIPESQRSQPGAFAYGAILYSVLLIL